MKKTQLLFMVLATLSSPVSANCLHNNKIYSIGSELAIDKLNPMTIENNAQFKQRYGVEPDGGSFKIAICNYVVFPKDRDFPAKQNRQYVWVSSSLNYEASKYQEGE